MKKYFLFSLVLAIFLNFGCKKEDSNPSTPAPAGPKAPLLSEPADSAVDVLVNPTLIWFAVDDAESYSLQVSTSKSFETVLFAENGIVATQKQISGLTNFKSYFWRVRSENKNGISAWSLVRTFTTTLGVAPQSPLLIYPANNDTGVSVTPKLKWSAVPGAANYTVQISTSTYFSTIRDSATLRDTFFIAKSLDSSKIYYWRINATNGFGTSAYSPVNNFTTVAAGTAPVAPTLTTPANNETGVSLQPTLTWNASTGAASYTLQVSLSSTFSSFACNQSGLTGTSRQITGLSNNTKYYWRVSATNSFGTSAYSTVWNFTTAAANNPPNAPSNPSPTNGATGQSTSPALSWSCTDPDGDPLTYDVYFGTDSNPTTVIATGQSGTSISRSGLSSSTTYYWKVTAKDNRSGQTTGSVWSFTTSAAANNPPNAPSNPSPTNGATAQSTFPTLSWSCTDPDGDPLTYDVYFGMDSNPTTTITTGQSGTSINRSWLLNSTSYYWKVTAKDNRGGQTTGSVWSFTTIMAYTAPAAPSLTTPANNDTGVGFSPTFIWNASTSATSYTLQISTSSTFSSLLYELSGLTATSKQVVGLDNKTKYYWRVSATNIYGTSAYSTVYNFTTAIGDTTGTPCPGVPRVHYQGKTYNTVQIGSQCWLKENLNVGVFVESFYKPATHSEVSNNGIIEKYCYDNNPSNCETYGGLYDWNEAMGYVTTAGAQGICPPGWHIPTHVQLQALATAVGGNGKSLKATWQGTGSGAGSNTSGFSALLGGRRYHRGGLDNLGTGYFWSSIHHDGYYAYSMDLFGNSSSIRIHEYYKESGLSVRCLKD